MADIKRKKLVLEDGAEYIGVGFGYDCERVCEVVFNTSVVGYQEIISDPSYTDQAVVMTYPLIGNYGIADEDYETRVPTIGALIVREYNDLPSNFRYTKTLSEVMEEYKIPGLSGIDTRKLARSIRNLGSRRGIITDADTPTNAAVEKIDDARGREHQRRSDAAAGAARQQRQVQRNHRDAQQRQPVGQVHRQPRFFLNHRISPVRS